MKRFFLIDGSGFLYRAYYAFPELTNNEGKNQNVVYGFLRMMLKLFLERPDYFVIAWDSPVKTHRHEVFPEYKANRKKMEDDFKQQIPVVQNLITQLGIATLVSPGYEADDILHTLVKTYEKDSDLLISLYSSDKDLKQLLSERVSIVDPMKNQRMQVFDFELEFGFSPRSIVDYLALVGDSADNVKGVAGIGPKRAGELISSYQTIENLYEHLDELGESLRGALEDGLDSVLQSKMLIQLQEVPSLSENSLSDFLYSFDYPFYRKVLIEDSSFPSLEKPLQELKKVFTQPQQLGLF